MYRFGNEFFTGDGFSRDEHGRIRQGDATDVTTQAVRLGASTEQRGAVSSPNRAPLALGLSSERFAKLVELARQMKEVIDAQADGLLGDVDGMLCGHSDDDAVWLGFAPLAHHNRPLANPLARQFREHHFGSNAGGFARGRRVSHQVVKFSITHDDADARHARSRLEICTRFPRSLQSFRRSKNPPVGSSRAPASN